MIWWKIVLIVLTGYVFGNISFAKIIAHYMMKSSTDSANGGNPGTMNIYRKFGFKVGVLCFVSDVAKGAIPALIGYGVFGNTAGMFIGGSGAVLGHVFPAVYKFKGGKGVATAFGVFWVVNPLVMSVAFFGGYVIFMLFFEMSGATSILTTAAVACFIAKDNAGNYIVLGCLMGIFLLVWFLHRKNILKTLTGDEHKTAVRGLFVKKLRKRDRIQNAGESDKTIKN